MERASFRHVSTHTGVGRAMGGFVSVGNGLTCTETRGGTNRSRGTDLSGCSGTFVFARRVTPVCPMCTCSRGKGHVCSRRNGAICSFNSNACDAHVNNFDGRGITTGSKLSIRRALGSGFGNHNAVGVGVVSNLGTATGVNCSLVGRVHASRVGRLCKSTTGIGNHACGCGRHVRSFATGRLLACDGTFNRRGVSVVTNRRSCSCALGCRCARGCGFCAVKGPRFGGTVAVDSVGSCARRRDVRDFFNHMGCSFSGGCCLSTDVHSSRSSGFRPSRHHNAF